MKSSSSFFSHGRERMDTYAVTDNVTDEHFETALAEAKAEKNLSRANILRKIKGEPAPGNAMSHCGTTRRPTERLDTRGEVPQCVNFLPLCPSPRSLSARTIGWVFEGYCLKAIRGI